MPKWFKSQVKKMLSQNVTYLQVLENGGASFLNQRNDKLLCDSGFALFYAKSGRMVQPSVVAFLPFFIND